MHTSAEKEENIDTNLFSLPAAVPASSVDPPLTLGVCFFFTTTTTIIVYLSLIS
jgi:hypothetical protein